MFEFWLLGRGAIGRGGDGIDACQRFSLAAAAAQVLRPPVHGDERLRGLDRVRGLRRQHDGAALAGHVHQIAIFQAAAPHVLRVQLHTRFGHVAEQAAEGAGACHAVPVVAQATGGQRERETRFALLGHGLVG